MLNLKNKKINAELTVKATSTGVDALADGLKDVAKSGAPAAVAVERVEKVTSSAERDAQRLSDRYDKLSRAERHRTRDINRLTRAYEQGAVDADRYEDLLGRINRQFDAQSVKLKKAERSMASYGRETREVGRSLGGLKARAGGVAATFAVGFSLNALVGQSRRAVSELDAIAKAARSLDGIESGGFLQSSRFALGRVGFNEGESDKILTTLNKRVGELRAGFGALKGPIDQIEPSLAKLLISAGDAEEVFDVFVGGLERIEDPAKRAALAAAGLDASFGKRFGAAIEEGAEGLKEFRRIAEQDLGIVIPVETLLMAEGLGDRLGEAQLIVDVEMKRAFVELAPLIAGAAKGAATFAANVGQGIREFQARRVSIEDASEDQLRTKIALRHQRIERIQELLAGGPEQFGFSSADLKDDVSRLNSEIATFEERLSSAGGAGQRAGRNIAQGLEEAASATAALLKAQERRDNLAAQLTAARSGGALALSAERARQTREAAADAAKLTGAARNEFIETTKARDDLATSLAKIEKGFNNASSASRRAAGIGDVFKSAAKDLQADIDKLERLNVAADLGRPAYEEQLELEDRREKVAAIVLRAQKAGTDLTAQQRKDLDALFANASKLGKDLDDKIDGFAVELPSSDAVDAFGDLLKRVWRGFGQEGEEELESLGKTAKRLFGGIFTPGFSGDSPANAAGGVLAAYGAALPGALVNVGFGVLERQSADLFTQRAGFGKANALNLVADELSAASPALGALIRGGRAGLALANLIDGNGANRTTAAVGQFFGPIGGFLAGLFSKASRNGAVVSLGDGGSVVSTGKKDKGRGDENLDALFQFTDRLGSAIDGLEALTGARARDLRRSIALDDVDGYYILGPNGYRRNFGEDGSAAFDALLDRSVEVLKGGDRELVKSIGVLSRAVDDADDFLSRAEALSTARRDPLAIVDPLKERVDALEDAFTGLTKSSRAVAEEFRSTAAVIGQQTNRDLQREKTSFISPLAGEVDDLIAAQEARREEIERLNKAGGNVSLDLLAEVERRQALNLFNLDSRRAAATDPVAAQLVEIGKRQVLELEGMKRLIDRGRVDPDELTLLEFVQAGERTQAFLSLPDEERARLSGSDAFDTFRSAESELGAAFSFLTEELNDFGENLSRTLDSIRQQRAADSARLSTFNRAIDVAAPRGSGRRRLEILEARFGDVTRRSLAGDRDAQDSFLEVGNLFREASLKFNASTLEGQADLDLIDANTLAVRDVIKGQVSRADRQLAAAEETNDLLKLLVAEVSRGQGLDVFRVADLAKRLSPDFDVTDAARDVARLLEVRERASTAAADAVAAADPQTVYRALPRVLLGADARLAAEQQFLTANDEGVSALSAFRAADPVVARFAARPPTPTANDQGLQSLSDSGFAPSPSPFSAQRPVQQSTLAAAGGAGSFDQRGLDAMLTELNEIARRIGAVVTAINDQSAQDARLNQDVVSGLTKLQNVRTKRLAGPGR